MITAQEARLRAQEIRKNKRVIWGEESLKTIEKDILEVMNAGGVCTCFTIKSLISACIDLSDVDDLVRTLKSFGYKVTIRDSLHNDLTIIIVWE